MRGDPRQCRLNAARCLALAKHVRKSEARQVFTEMAETWNRLATETECGADRSRRLLSKLKLFVVARAIWSLERALARPN